MSSRWKVNLSWPTYEYKNKEGLISVLQWSFECLIIYRLPDQYWNIITTILHRVILSISLVLLSDVLFQRAFNSKTSRYVHYRILSGNHLGLYANSKKTTILMVKLTYNCLVVQTVALSCKLRVAPQSSWIYWLRSCAMSVNFFSVRTADIKQHNIT